MSSIPVFPEPEPIAAPPRYHSLILLLGALLVLLAAFAYRAWVSRVPLAPTTPLAPAALELSDPAYVIKLQNQLAANPDDTAAYAQLGLAYLQQVRERADAQFYTKADAAFAAALQRDPQQIDALTGRGILALARHDFEVALVWGAQARALNPYRASILGILVDGYVELGRYPEAVHTLQTMVDLRPGLPSYSRVSYVRELHGDVPGAILAMSEAARAGVPGTEAMLWSQYQLGTLYFNNGDFENARHAYDYALFLRPDYIYAQAGEANLKAAAGNTAGAIADYEGIVQRLPLPQFLIALGDLYEVTGQPTEARNQYNVVRAMQQLNAAAGMNVDLELALFDADHGADPAQTLQLARTAYAKRPSIYGADVLAWALYRAGRFDEASRYSAEALRLGTRDAMLHYHAGKIAAARGDLTAATEHFRTALAINPAFSVRYAPDARAALAR